MEEHKALKYRDYRDKLYMIIGTEHFDDTHPYLQDTYSSSIETQNILSININI